MHIKHMHEMIEKLSEYGKCMIEAGVGNGEVNLCDAEKIIDMIGELSEAEYHARIAKAMEKEEEDEKEEEKYMLRMLKEEHGDEYKRMREEYGEDEGERRFYDNYRYKRTGEFAPKGRGSYMPRSSGRRSRRGYTEPPYLHMPYDYRYDMDDYDYADAERMRDMDRKGMNRMYYTDGGSMGNPSGGSYGGNSGGNGGQYGNAGGNSGGNVRGYSDGYNDGYREGERNGKGSESRYDRARRGYEETKQNHKGNTPEDRQLTMKEMEKVLNVVFDEIDDMLQDAPAEMKNMVKSKGMSRMQKIQ